MANPTGATATAGDMAKTSGMWVISRNAAGTIVKGNVCQFDGSGDVLQEPTTQTGDRGNGFCVALEAGTSGNNIRVVIGGYVYVVADGTIVPNNLVKASGSTAGEVIASEEPQDSTAGEANTTEIQADIDSARDFYGKAVGRYLGHQLEEDDPTDAANGDIVAIGLSESI